MDRIMPDADIEKYDGIDGVVKSLVKVQSENIDLESQPTLCDVLRRIFIREGIKDVEINNKNIDLIIDKLSNFDESVSKKENELLKKAANKKEELETKTEGSVVPVAVIRKLVGEYQLYLDNEVSEEEALKLVEKRNKNVVSKKNVETLIKRQREMYWENLKAIQNFKAESEGRPKSEDVILMKADEKKDENASNLEKKMAMTLAEEQLVLEETIEGQISGVEAEELSRKIFEKVVIPGIFNDNGTLDVKKILEFAKQTDGLDINSERQELLVETVSKVNNSLDINIKIDQEADRVMEIVMGTFKSDETLEEVFEKQEEAIRVSVVRMVERTIDDRTLNTNTEVERTISEIKSLYKESTGLDLDPSLDLKMETAIKGAAVEVENWIGSRAEEINRYRTEKLSNTIYTKIIYQNPDISQAKKTAVKEYGDLVSNIYYYKSEIERHKNEAVDNVLSKGFSPEKTANAYSDLRGLYSILKMNPGDFNGLIYKYRQLKFELKGIELPYEIKELKSFEGLMSLASEVPEVKNLINFTQKYIKVYDTVNAISGGFLEKLGLKQLGMSALDSVGGQAMSKFVTSSLEVFAEQGVKKGAWAILKGIISGGVEVGAGAAEGAAGAAATGGVAGAVAAFQAIPVVGQVILIVVVVVVALIKIIKPVIKIATSVLKAMGVDFDKMKAFFQEYLGGFFGGILSWGVKTGILIISIPAALSMVSISAVVGPVVIFLMIGLFAYTTLNGNLVSSLVPPVRMGGGQNQSTAPGGVLVPGENNDFTGECSVGQYVQLTRQCDPAWANMSLPGGCTICYAGCGPTSVSMILQRQSPDNTVVNLLKDPIYSSVDCNGSGMDQHEKILRKYLGDDAISYGSSSLCTPKDIASWICDGKIVLVAAQFFNSKGTGGHFVLGVAVDGGQIVTADPYYGTRSPFDGDTSYGHVDLSQDIWCLLVDPKK